MKKLLIFFFFVLMIPVMNVQAAEKNIVLGQPFILNDIPFKEGSLLYSLSDGSLVTRYGFAASNQAGNHAVWMTFDAPYNITKINAPNNRVGYLRFDFYNADGQKVNSVNYSKSTGYQYVQINNVQTVHIVNTYRDIANWVDDIEVWVSQNEPSGVSINSFSALHDRVTLYFSGLYTDSFEIYRDGVLIDTVKSSPYVVTGLSPLTSYKFHVVGKNQYGSVSSSQVNVKTQDQPPPPTFKDFRVFEIMDKSLRMSFSFLDVDRHFIYANGVLVDTLPNNATSYVMKADPLTTYKLKIVAENDYGQTSSNEIEVTTLEELVLPYDLNLSVSNVLPDRVDLDVSVKKAKTIKFYRDNRLINTIAGDIKIYTDNTVDSDREYMYKFVAENQLGSVTSNELKVKTKRPPPMDVPDVYITPGSKGFLDSIVLKITSRDPDASLFYSFDGKDWKKYESPITLKESREVYAKAVNVLGVESGIVANKYVLQSEPKVQLGVDLRDVAWASESHFNVIWPIVAFLVGVVSALYIARNTRDLF